MHATKSRALKLAFIVVAVLLFITLAEAKSQSNRSAKNSKAAKASTKKKTTTKKPNTKIGDPNKGRAQSPGPKPNGAVPTLFHLSKGDLFAWISTTPSNRAAATEAVIITHGVDRNANTYFTTINNAYNTAKKQKLPFATANTLRIAPMFFSTADDSKYLNDSTLAWGANNAWAAGDNSNHPKGSGMSTLTVYDELVEQLTNRANFPNMRMITFVGHGGGAIVTQRYAAIKNTPDPDGVTIRYAVGDESTNLYFTTDRPSGVDPNKCPLYNSWHYGFDDYYLNYNLAGSRATLFKAFVKRDVRYLVGLEDKSTTDGDQDCEARLMGGPMRKNRGLAYWKYIHLLGSVPLPNANSYPGTFASLTNNSQTLAEFKVDSIAGSLSQIKGVGHNAPGILGSAQGLRAVFA